MELFVYSDESGVFDRIHNDFYVYGGYIFLGKEERDIAARKYAQKERNIQSHYPKGEELKACYISNKDKLMLFKRMNGYVRFGAVVSEKHIEPNIFTHKKTKQRYLDYVYKMTLKNALIRLNEEGLCKSSDIDSIYVFVDEHTTATDGKYELKEALLQELIRKKCRDGYPEDPKERAKIMRFLASKGFGPGEIRRALNNLT